MLQFFNSTFGFKLMYLFGIINFICALFLFSTCRCIKSPKYYWLTKYKIFSKLYPYHCYVWKIFIISIILHTILAIIIFDNPWF